MALNTEEIDMSVEKKRLLADTIAANRRILEDVQYHVRKMEYDGEWERKRNGRKEGDNP